MRTCAFEHCTNGMYKMNRWMKSMCAKHQCLHHACSCPDPFKLFTFPPKRHPERRAEWIKIVNKTSPKIYRNSFPTNNDRLCSEHFVNGAPSSQHPNPTLNLDYPDLLPSNPGIDRSTEVSDLIMTVKDEPVDDTQMENPMNYRDRTMGTPPANIVCYAVNCRNGGYSLGKWEQDMCEKHGVPRFYPECRCRPPFELFPFPNKKKNPEQRHEWMRLFNRADPNKKNSIRFREPKQRDRVCSDHFVDGRPTIVNPNPTLKLGHDKFKDKVENTGRRARRLKRSQQNDAFWEAKWKKIKEARKKAKQTDIKPKPRATVDISIDPVEAAINAEYAHIRKAPAIKEALNPVRQEYSEPVVAGDNGSKQTGDGDGSDSLVNSKGKPVDIRIGYIRVPEPREREVLIQVYASAINKAEPLQILSKFTLEEAGVTLGLEAAGIVVKKGTNCSQKWNIGDRVMALVPGGGNAEYVVVYEDHVMSVPNDIPFTKAAAIPEVWLTAYQLLHCVGGLKKEDTVLIYGGGNILSTALVQLVTLAGGTSYVVSDTKHRIDTAKSLGAKDGFNYTEGTFYKQVLEATKDKGVDLVLDCVGASLFESTTHCLAVEGRWILYGSTGGEVPVGGMNGDILTRVLKKRLRLEGTTLKSKSKEAKADLVASFQEKILPHFEPKGKLKPIIDCMFPLDQLSQAHALVRSKYYKHTGKIVINVKPEPGIENIDTSET